MIAPSYIWAVDGETPYYYVEGEPDKPKSATKYIRCDLHADILQELNRVRVRNQDFDT